MVRQPGSIFADQVIGPRDPRGRPCLFRLPMLTVTALRQCLGRRGDPLWCRELRVIGLGHRQLGPSCQMCTATYRSIYTRSINHLGPRTLLVVHSLHEVLKTSYLARTLLLRTNEIPPGAFENYIFISLVSPAVVRTARDVSEGRDPFPVVLSIAGSWPKMSSSAVQAYIENLMQEVRVETSFGATWRRWGGRSFASLVNVTLSGGRAPGAQRLSPRS